LHLSESANILHLQQSVFYRLIMRVFLFVFIAASVASCASSTNKGTIFSFSNDNLKTILNPKVKNDVVIAPQSIQSLKLQLKNAENIALNSYTLQSLREYRAIYMQLAIAIAEKQHEDDAATHSPLLGEAKEVKVFDQELHGIVNGAPVSSMIFFEFNSSFLSPDWEGVINENADFLTRTPAVRVMVAGYADLKGDGEYNLWLGKRRAARVADALILKGVSPEQITYVSYGESYPLTINDVEQDKNRRVEFIY
jgi:outer membrane protein OmpA-like peptidoglycan-associated protein